MMSGGCSGLLLCVLIILLALEYSSANVYQGNIGSRKLPRGSKTGQDVSLHSDVSDSAVATDDDNGSTFLEARKMLQRLDEKSLYISGKNEPADLEKSEGRSRVPGAVDDPKATTASSGNENIVANHDHYSTKKNDESKAFLEAADEVANLMRKDYKGADQPRRKPPINNHEPKD